MMKVLVGGYNHETNTFSAERTPLTSFQIRGDHSGIYVGEELIKHFHGSHTVLGGFIDAAEKGGFTLLPTFYAAAMPSGIVEKSAFTSIENRLCEAVTNAKKVDGILLHLHGATVAEDVDDPEGHTLQRIRTIVGARMPIVVVNDLHGNISPLMVENADVLIGYKTSPHVDYYERGLEGVAVLAAIIRGGVKPIMVLRKPPILPRSAKTDTTIPPMSVLIALAREMEREQDVVNVSINGGFCPQDVAHAGLSIVVTTNDNLSLAEKHAKLLEQLAWALRRAFLADLSSVDDAIDRVIAAKEGPIILADQSDNALGGGPADGTVLLQRLITANQASTGVIRDPDAVDQAINAGVGTQIELTIGAKTDRLHGSPITAKGRVRLISDGTFRTQRGLSANMGRTVVFTIGSTDIVITEYKAPQVDPLVFKSVGVDPSTKKAVVVKSSHAFTVLFGDFAKEMLFVDTPGICGNMPPSAYHKIRRPMAPFDDV